ncbi:hypothetical protein [Actinoplanes palleronii]|uniref:Uncharacterized protein n=1 Tax=Actinoplanes palleronii TaxID=113570 RepID=A0ABQ4BJA0_9ACTN|nr:hypothetical protein [Actinoplanes palleronii]GIE70756.1 hypothetical protein Apa02nite_068640 [Actinoplanes palleronii]
MTRSEIALLLGAAAARDQRTIGDADVLAWHEDLGDLDFSDARAALGRHFRESTDRLMPAHIRRLVRIIRDERRASSVVTALPPGKTQDDPDRAERIARNKARLSAVMAQIAAKRAVPSAPAEEPTASDEIRMRAIARAQAERTRRAS